VSGMDRIRLNCVRCDSSFDVWGTIVNGTMRPDDGLLGLRCPSCNVVCDQVVEVNGEEVA
jgi:hypothetical protein